MTVSYTHLDVYKRQQMKYGYVVPCRLVALDTISRLPQSPQNTVPFR